MSVPTGKRMKISYLQAKCAVNILCTLNPVSLYLCEKRAKTVCLQDVYSTLIQYANSSVQMFCVTKGTNL